MTTPENEQKFEFSLRGKETGLIYGFMRGDLEYWHSVYGCDQYGDLDVAYELNEMFDNAQAGADEPLVVLYEELGLDDDNA